MVTTLPTGVESTVRCRARGRSGETTPTPNGQHFPVTDNTQSVCKVDSVGQGREVACYDLNRRR